MEILCAKFIRMDEDDSEFYIPLHDYPAPLGRGGKMIRCGMYYSYGIDNEIVIFDGSYWLRNDDPRIVR